MDVALFSQMDRHCLIQDSGHLTSCDEANSTDMKVKLFLTNIFCLTLLRHETNKTPLYLLKRNHGFMPSNCVCVRVCAIYADNAKDRIGVEVF